MEWLLVAFAALVGALLGHAFTPRRQKPPQTAEEVKNDDATATANAVTTAADKHDVPADVVADDLEWLLSDDDM